MKVIHIPLMEDDAFNNVVTAVGSPTSDTGATRSTTAANAQGYTDRDYQQTGSEYSVDQNPEGNKEQQEKLVGGYFREKMTSAKTDAEKAQVIKDLKDSYESQGFNNIKNVLDSCNFKFEDLKNFYDHLSYSVMFNKDNPVIQFLNSGLTSDILEGSPKPDDPRNLYSALNIITSIENSKESSKLPGYIGNMESIIYYKYLYTNVMDDKYKIVLSIQDIGTDNTKSKILKTAIKNNTWKVYIQPESLENKKDDKSDNKNEDEFIKGLTMLYSLFISKVGGKDHKVSGFEAKASKVSGKAYTADGFDKAIIIINGISNIAYSKYKNEKYNYKNKMQRLFDQNKLDLTNVKKIKNTLKKVVNGKKNNFIITLDSKFGYTKQQIETLLGAISNLIVK